MKTTVALIIKFVGVLVAAWISFMIFGTAAFWWVFTIAVAVTALNFLIGDLLVLPRWGNIWSSILNGIIAGATAWVIMYYVPVTYDYISSVWVFALIIAVAEYFFHMYLISAEIVEKRRSDSDFYKKNKLNYNAETGSELFPYGKNNLGDTNYRNIDSGYYKNTNYSDTDHENSYTGGVSDRNFGANYGDDINNPGMRGFNNSTSKSGVGSFRGGKNKK